MYVKIFFLAVLLNVIFVRGLLEEKKDCITPNGENATCITIRTCHILMDAIQTRNRSVIEFARKSQCGYDKEPLVCCGSAGHYTTPTNFFGVFPNGSVCGIQSGGNDRIIGGNMTDLADYPWLAALEYLNLLSGNKSEIRCGGSVISDRYILTAASCLDLPHYQLNSVVLGEWQLSTDPDCVTFVGMKDCADPVVRVNIESKTPHTQYDAASLKHDIALLRTDKKIRYTDFVRPICLANKDVPDPALSGYMKTAGWPILKNGTIYDIKYEAEFLLKPTESCRAKFGKNIIAIANQLCLAEAGFKGYCKGNQGGPLMRLLRNADGWGVKWIQEGVASLGIKCGFPDDLVVYTKISSYIDWIVHILSQEQN